VRTIHEEGALEKWRDVQGNALMIDSEQRTVELGKD